MSSDIRHAAAQVTGVDFVMMTHSVGAHFDNNGSIHVIDTVANHQTRDAVGNLNHSYEAEPSATKMTFLDKLLAGYK